MLHVQGVVFSRLQRQVRNDFSFILIDDIGVSFLVNRLVPRAVKQTADGRIRVVTFGPIVYLSSKSLILCLVLGELVVDLFV